MTTYCRNVFQLLARREISPTGGRHVRRKFHINSTERRFIYEKIHARNDLYSWVEAQLFDYVSASSFDFDPPVQTTIMAIAFSPDGTMVACANTDNTIRIIDYESRICKRVLKGHTQLLLTLQFHPTKPGILASGGLDHQVRLWNVDTADCIFWHIFDARVNAIAFHALEDILAIAAEQQIYIWYYARVGHRPAAVLRSSSLFTTVHFHPRGAPLLVTTELNDESKPYAELEPATHVRCRRRLSSILPGTDIKARRKFGRPCQPPMQIDEEEMCGLRKLERHRSLFPHIERWLMGETRGIPHRTVYLRGRPTLDSTVALFFNGEILHYAFVPESSYGHPHYVLDVRSDPPRTSQLKIWSYDVQRPYEFIDDSRCRLTVSDVVFGRYGDALGAHLSPCGRFLVACVVCKLSKGTCACADDELMMDERSSYTISPNGDRVIYELRVFSMEEATLGLILSCKEISAASSLAYLQFSPTSDHVLVAYCEYHKELDTGSYLGQSMRIHFFTIIEAYRVTDMEEISIALSCNDEVNSAIFHSHAGRGIIYGTMGGDLRFLRMDHRDERNVNCVATNEIQHEIRKRHEYYLDLWTRP